MTNRILIASVYSPTSFNEHWYPLQKKFLTKNTYAEYDFKVVLNNSRTSLFENEEIILRNNSNIGHPAGLHQIIDYMRGVQDQYEYFLLLDSDCFPVRAGWDQILSEQMRHFNKSIAAPIRYENLDMFPHPCAVFMDTKGLNNPDLDFTYTITKNLLNDEIDEVGGAMVKLANSVLPLIRTNVINLHPIAAGVYHHVFYHHGAGSRGFDFRVVKDYLYHKHWLGVESHRDFGEKLLQRLLDDPEKFIEKLMVGN